MDTQRTKDEAGTTLTDHLKLQAWLAKAELRNPSLHKEVKVLAQWRDELRVQAHLGQLEAREEWDRVEALWLKVRPRLEDMMETTAQEVKAILADIRKGYERLDQH